MLDFFDNLYLHYTYTEPVPAHLRHDSLRRQQLLCKLRHRLEEIRLEPDISDIEDGRLWVLVYARNDLAVLHARQVLDLPADADAQVQLRRDVDARLSDLQRCICQSAIACCARSSDRGAH